MKTYSESKDLPPFDWNKALDDAIEQEPIQYTAMKLELRSCSWVTCACGNQCASLPRSEGGEPKDSSLRQLGIVFHWDIISFEWAAAKETLAQIEARSAFLLQELSLTP